MFRWALWQNESRKCPSPGQLWARSIVPRNTEGAKAIQLFLKLPSNINYMHPFRNLGVCFIFPQKVPPFTSSQRQVQSCNCKTRTGSGRKKPGQWGGQRNSTKPYCHASPKQGRECVCVASDWFLHVQQNASHLVDTQKCWANEWKREKAKRESLLNQVCCKKPQWASHINVKSESAILSRTTVWALAFWEQDFLLILYVGP